MKKQHLKRQALTSVLVIYCMFIQALSPALAQSPSLHEKPTVDASKAVMSQLSDEDLFDEIETFLHKQSVNCKGAFSYTTQEFEEPLQQVHAELGLVDLLLDDFKEGLPSPPYNQAPIEISIQNQKLLSCVPFKLQELFTRIFEDIGQYPECFTLENAKDLSECQSVYGWSSVADHIANDTLQKISRIHEIMALHTSSPSIGLALTDVESRNGFVVWNQLTQFLEAHKTKHLFRMDRIQNVFETNAQTTNKYDQTSEFLVQSLGALSTSLGEGAEDLITFDTKETENVHTYDAQQTMGMSLQVLQDASFALWKQLIRLYGKDYFQAWQRPVPQERLSKEQREVDVKYNYGEFKSAKQVAVDAICNTNPQGWERPSLAVAWQKACTEGKILDNGKSVQLQDHLAKQFAGFQDAYLTPSHVNELITLPKEELGGLLFDPVDYPINRHRNPLIGYQKDIAAFNERVNTFNQTCDEIHSLVQKDKSQFHAHAPRHVTSYGAPVSSQYIITYNLVQSVAGKDRVATLKTKHGEFTYSDELSRMMSMVPWFREHRNYRVSYKEAVKACAAHGVGSLDQHGSMRPITNANHLVTAEKYIISQLLQSIENAYGNYVRAWKTPDQINHEEVLEYYLQYQPGAALTYIITHPSVAYAQGLANYIDSYADEERWHEIERWFVMALATVVIGGVIGTLTGGIGSVAAVGLINILAFTLSAYEVVRSPMRMQRLVEHNQQLVFGLVAQTQPYVDAMIQRYDQMQSMIRAEFVHSMLNAAILPFLAGGAIKSAQQMQLMRLLGQLERGKSAGGMSLQAYQRLITRIQNNPMYRPILPKASRGGGYAKHPMADKVKGPEIEWNRGGNGGTPQSGPKTTPSEAPKLPGPKHRQPPKRYRPVPNRNNPDVKPSAPKKAETTVQNRAEGYTLDEMLNETGIMLESQAPEAIVMPELLPAQTLEPVLEPLVLAPDALIEIATKTSVPGDASLDTANDLDAASKKRTQDLVKRMLEDQKRKYDQAWQLVNSGGNSNDIYIISLIMGFASAGNEHAKRWLQKHFTPQQYDYVRSIPGFHIPFDIGRIYRRALSDYAEKTNVYVETWLKTKVGTPIDKEMFWPLFLYAQIPSEHQNILAARMGLLITENQYARIPPEKSAPFRKLVQVFDKSMGSDGVDLSKRSDNLEITRDDIRTYLQGMQKQIDAYMTQQWLAHNDMKSIAQYLGWEKDAVTQSAGSMLADQYLASEDFPEDPIFSGLLTIARRATTGDQGATQWLMRHRDSLEEIINKSPRSPEERIDPAMLDEMLAFLERFDAQLSIENHTPILLTPHQTQKMVQDYNLSVRNSDTKNYVKQQLEAVGCSLSMIREAIQGLQNMGSFVPVRNLASYELVYRHFGNLLGWSLPEDILANLEHIGSSYDIGWLSFIGEFDWNEHTPLFEMAMKMYDSKFEHIKDKEAQAYFNKLPRRTKIYQETVYPQQTFATFQEVVGFDGLDEERQQQFLRTLYAVHLAEGFEKMRMADALKWMLFHRYGVNMDEAHDTVRLLMSTGILGQHFNGQFSESTAAYIVLSDAPFAGDNIAYTEEICHLSLFASTQNLKQLALSYIQKHNIQCPEYFEALYLLEKENLSDIEIQDLYGNQSRVSLESLLQATEVIQGKRPFSYEDLHVIIYMITEDQQMVEPLLKDQAHAYLYLLYSDDLPKLYQIMDKYFIPSITEDLLVKTNGVLTLEQREAYLIQTLAYISRYINPVASQSYFENIPINKADLADEAFQKIENSIQNSSYIQQAFVDNPHMIEIYELIKDHLPYFASLDEKKSVSSPELDHFSRTIEEKLSYNPYLSRAISEHIRKNLHLYTKKYLMESPQSALNVVQKELLDILLQHRMNMIQNIMYLVHLENADQINPNINDIHPFIRIRLHALISLIQEMGVSYETSQDLVTRLAKEGILGNSEDQSKPPRHTKPSNQFGRESRTLINIAYDINYNDDHTKKLVQKYMEGFVGDQKLVFQDLETLVRSQYDRINLQELHAIVYMIHKRNEAIHKGKPFKKLTQKQQQKIRKNLAMFTMYLQERHRISAAQASATTHEMAEVHILGYEHHWDPRRYEKALEIIEGISTYNPEYDQDICYVSIQHPRADYKAMAKSYIERHAIQCDFSELTDDQIEATADYFRENPQDAQSLAFAQVTQAHLEQTRSFLNQTFPYSIEYDPTAITTPLTPEVRLALEYMAANPKLRFSDNEQKIALAALYRLHESNIADVYPMLNQRNIPLLTEHLLKQHRQYSTSMRVKHLLPSAILRIANNMNPDQSRQYFSSLDEDLQRFYVYFADQVRALFMRQKGGAAQKDILDESIEKLSQGLMQLYVYDMSSAPDLLQNYLNSYMDDAIALDTWIRLRAELLANQDTLENVIQTSLAFSTNGHTGSNDQDANSWRVQEVAQFLRELVVNMTVNQFENVLYLTHMENVHDPDPNHVVLRLAAVRAYLEDLGMNGDIAGIMISTMANEGVLGKHMVNESELYEIHKKALEKLFKQGQGSDEYYALHASWVARKAMKEKYNGELPPRGIYDKYNYLIEQKNFDTDLTMYDVRRTKYFELLGSTDEERWHRYLYPSEAIISSLDEYFLNDRPIVHESALHKTSQRISDRTFKLIDDAKVYKNNGTYERVVQTNYIRNLHGSKRVSYDHLLKILNQYNPEHDSIELQSVMYFTHQRNKEISQGRPYRDLPQSRQKRILKNLAYFSSYLQERHGVPEEIASMITKKLSDSKVLGFDGDKTQIPLHNKDVFDAVTETMMQLNEEDKLHNAEEYDIVALSLAAREYFEILAKYKDHDWSREAYARFADHKDVDISDRFLYRSEFFQNLGVDDAERWLHFLMPDAATMEYIRSFLGSGTLPEDPQLIYDTQLAKRESNYTRSSEVPETSQTQTNPIDFFNPVPDMDNRIIGSMTPSHTPSSNGQHRPDPLPDSLEDLVFDPFEPAPWTEEDFRALQGDEKPLVLNDTDQWIQAAHAYFEDHDVDEAIESHYHSLKYKHRLLYDLFIREILEYTSDENATTLSMLTTYTHLQNQKILNGAPFSILRQDSQIQVLRNLRMFRQYLTETLNVPEDVARSWIRNLSDEEVMILGKEIGTFEERLMSLSKPESIQTETMIDFITYSLDIINHRIAGYIETPTILAQTMFGNDFKIFDSEQSKLIADRLVQSYKYFEIEYIPIYVYYAQKSTSAYKNALKLRELLGVKRQPGGHLLFTHPSRVFSTRLGVHLKQTYPNVDWIQIRAFLRLLQNVDDVAFIQDNWSGRSSFVDKLEQQFMHNFREPYVIHGHHMTVDYKTLRDKVVKYKLLLKNYPIYAKYLGMFHNWYPTVDNLKIAADRYGVNLTGIFENIEDYSAEEFRVDVGEDVFFPFDDAEDLSDSEIAAINDFLTGPTRLTQEMVDLMNKFTMYMDFHGVKESEYFQTMYDQVRQQMYYANHSFERDDLTYYDYQPPSTSNRRQNQMQLMKTFQLIDKNTSVPQWHRTFDRFTKSYGLQPFWNLETGDGFLIMHAWPKRSLQNREGYLYVNEQGEEIKIRQNDYMQANIYFLQDTRTQKPYFYIEPIGVDDPGKYYPLDFLPYLDTLFTPFGLIGGKYVNSAPETLSIMRLENDQVINQDPLTEHIDPHPLPTSYEREQTIQDFIQHVIKPAFPDAHEFREIQQFAFDMDNMTQGLNYLECLNIILATHIRGQKSNLDQSSDFTKVKALSNLIEIGVLYGYPREEITRRVTDLARYGILGADATTYEVMEEPTDMAPITSNEREDHHLSLSDRPNIYNKGDLLNEKESQLFESIKKSRLDLQDLSAIPMEEDPELLSDTEKFVLNNGATVYVKRGQNLDGQTHKPYRTVYREYDFYRLAKHFTPHLVPTSLLIEINDKDYFVSAQEPNMLTFSYVDHENQHQKDVDHITMFEKLDREKNIHPSLTDFFPINGLVDTRLPSELIWLDLWMGVTDRSLYRNVTLHGIGQNIEVTKDNIPYIPPTTPEVKIFDWGYALNIDLDAYLKEYQKGQLIEQRGPPEPGETKEYSFGNFLGQDTIYDWLEAYQYHRLEPHQEPLVTMYDILYANKTLTEELLATSKQELKSMLTHTHASDVTKLLRNIEAIRTFYQIGKSIRELSYKWMNLHTQSNEDLMAVSSYELINFAHGTGSMESLWNKARSYFRDELDKTFLENEPLTKRKFYEKELEALIPYGIDEDVIEIILYQIHELGNTKAGDSPSDVKTTAIQEGMHFLGLLYPNIPSETWKSFFEALAHEDVMILGKGRKKKNNRNKKGKKPKHKQDPQNIDKTHLISHPSMRQQNALFYEGYLDEFYIHQTNHPIIYAEFDHLILQLRKKNKQNGAYEKYIGFLQKLVDPASYISYQDYENTYAIHDIITELSSLSFEDQLNFLNYWDQAYRHAQSMKELRSQLEKFQFLGPKIQQNPKVSRLVQTSHDAHDFQDFFVTQVLAEEQKDPFLHFDREQNLLVYNHLHFDLNAFMDHWKKMEIQILEAHGPHKYPTKKMFRLVRAPQQVNALNDPLTQSINPKTISRGYELFFELEDFVKMVPFSHPQNTMTQIEVLETRHYLPIEITVHDHVRKGYVVFEGDYTVVNQFIDPSLKLEVYRSIDKIAMPRRINNLAQWNIGNPEKNEPDFNMMGIPLLLQPFEDDIKTGSYDPNQHGDIPEITLTNSFAGMEEVPTDIIETTWLFNIREYDAQTWENTLKVAERIYPYIRSEHNQIQFARMLHLIENRNGTTDEQIQTLYYFFHDILRQNPEREVLKTLHSVFFQKRKKDALKQIGDEKLAEDIMAFQVEHIISDESYQEVNKVMAGLIREAGIDLTTDTLDFAWARLTRYMYDLCQTREEPITSSEVWNKIPLVFIAIPGMRAIEFDKAFAYALFMWVINKVQTITGETIINDDDKIYRPRTDSLTFIGKAFHPMYIGVYQEEYLNMFKKIRGYIMVHQSVLQILDFAKFDDDDEKKNDIMKEFQHLMMSMLHANIENKALVKDLFQAFFYVRHELLFVNTYSLDNLTTAYELIQGEMYLKTFFERLANSTSTQDEMITSPQTDNYKDTYDVSLYVIEDIEPILSIYEPYFNDTQDDQNKFKQFSQSMAQLPQSYLDKGLSFLRTMQSAHQNPDVIALVSEKDIVGLIAHVGSLPGSDHRQQVLQAWIQTEGSSAYTELDRAFFESEQERISSWIKLTDTRREELLAFFRENEVFRYKNHEIAYLPQGKDFKVTRILSVGAAPHAIQIPQHYVLEDTNIYQDLEGYVYLSAVNERGQRIWLPKLLHPKYTIEQAYTSLPYLKPEPSDKDLKGQNSINHHYWTKMLGEIESTVQGDRRFEINFALQLFIAWDLRDQAYYTRNPSNTDEIVFHDAQSMLRSYLEDHLKIHPDEIDHYIVRIENMGILIDKESVIQDIIKTFLNYVYENLGDTYNQQHMTPLIEVNLAKNLMQVNPQLLQTFGTQLRLRLNKDGKFEPQEGIDLQDMIEGYEWIALSPITLHAPYHLDAFDMDPPSIIPVLELFMERWMEEKFKNIPNVLEPLHHFANTMYFQSGYLINPYTPDPFGLRSIDPQRVPKSTSYNENIIFDHFQSEINYFTGLFRIAFGEENVEPALENEDITVKLSQQDFMHFHLGKMRKWGTVYWIPTTNAFGNQSFTRIDLAKVKGTTGLEVEEWKFFSDVYDFEEDAPEPPKEEDNDDDLDLLDAPALQIFGTSEYADNIRANLDTPKMHHLFYNPRSNADQVAIDSYIPFHKAPSPEKIKKSTTPKTSLGFLLKMVDAYDGIDTLLSFANEYIEPARYTRTYNSLEQKAFAAQLLRYVTQNQEAVPTNQRLYCLAPTPLVKEFSTLKKRAAVKNPNRFVFECYTSIHHPAIQSMMKSSLEKELFVIDTNQAAIVQKGMSDPDTKSARDPDKDVWLLVPHAMELIRSEDDRMIHERDLRMIFLRDADQ